MFTAISISHQNQNQRQPLHIQPYLNLTTALDPVHSLQILIQYTDKTPKPTATIRHLNVFINAIVNAISSRLSPP